MIGQLIDPGLSQIQESRNVGSCTYKTGDEKNTKKGDSKKKIDDGFDELSWSIFLSSSPLANSAQLKESSSSVRDLLLQLQLRRWRILEGFGWGWSTRDRQGSAEAGKGQRVNNRTGVQ